MRDGGGSLKLYRAFLRLYPRTFRETYHAQLVEAFLRQRDQVRYRRTFGRLLFSWDIASDLIVSAFRRRMTHLSTSFARGRRPPAGQATLLVRLELLMQSLWRDVRYAFRNFRKNPGFAIVVLTTLALAIGANTAIFSVVDGILLKPLPHPNPEQLVQVWEVDTRSTPVQMRNVVAPANLRDWQDQNTVFQGLGGYSVGRLTVTGGDEPERVTTGFITTSFMNVMGVVPILGRTFVAEEFTADNDGVLMLSHGLWQRFFGGDREVVGKSLFVNGNPLTIVGVLPPQFDFRSTNVELWTPWAVPYNNRRSHMLQVVGRMRPGVTVEQAQRDMSAIVDRLRLEYPEYLTGWNVNVVSLRNDMVGNVRPTLLVLLGAVGLVLLIAAVNIANLLLARATSREPEMVVRAALGAGRMRLARQMLTESLVLATVGGVLGVAIAELGRRALLLLAPGNLPRLAEVTLDTRVLGFALLLTLVTGIVFAVVPALQGSTYELQHSLRKSSRISAGTRSIVARNLFVVSQLALSLMLLVGAGLMIRTFARLTSVDPGFQPGQALTMTLALPSSRYGAEDEADRLLSTVTREIERLPQVQAVGTTRFLPMVDAEWTFSILIEGRPDPGEGEKIDYGYHPVRPGYFRAIGIPIIRGRAFREADNEDAPAVAIINEALQARFWPNEDPVGKRFRLRNFDDAPWMEIVGIARNVKHDGLANRGQPMYYGPVRQSPVSGLRSRAAFVIRTSADPHSLIPALRGIVRNLDSDLPLLNVRTMDDVVAQSVAQPRFSMFLLISFAGVALVLAVVGIYGVMAYAVTQRTSELGVRIALGASQGQILKMVVGKGMTLATAGIVLGLLGAFATARTMETLLFQVNPVDPVTYVAVAVLFTLVTLLAAYVPARRASLVDPLRVMRAE